MGYKLIISPKGEGDLSQLDPEIAKRIVKKLLWFVMQPDPLRWARRLEGNAGGDFRYRIGDYRATGIVREHVIYILKIGHRSEIYR